MSRGFAPILLLVGVVAAALVGGTALLVRNISNNALTPQPVLNQVVSTPLPSGQSLLNTSTSSASPLSESGVDSTPTPQIGSDPKITKLENTIAELLGRIKELESKPTPTPTSSINKSPVYIPLGPGDSISSVNWSTASVPIITIDPADYPGYTSMQLEVTFQIYQGNGTAYARLYAYNDGTSILSSEVSTTSASYTTVTSGTFQLSGGKKSYKLQQKSTTGFSTNVQFARIKVNF